MWLDTYVIASAKEIDALNITLFSCINSTNVHLCNYCTKIFVIVVNTCVCRRSVDNKAVILSYPVHLLSLLRFLRLLQSTCCACYSTFAILLTLAYHVCLLHFLTLPCRLLVQCFLKLLRLLHSTEGIKRQSFHKLSTLSLFFFFFILFRLTIQFNFPLCKKLNINQDRFTEVQHYPV